MKPVFLTSDYLVVMLIPLALGLTLFYSYLYRQEAKSAKQLTLRQRWLLRALRVGVALLVILALAKPAVSMVRREERTPTVPILVDDSASMAFPDARENPLVEARPANKRSRFETALQVAQQLQEKLTLSHQVMVYTFSDALKSLRSLQHRSSERVAAVGADELFPETVRPTGEYSNVGEALKDTLRELASDRISGMILLSDGRETGGSPSMKDLATQAATAQVPVHAIVLGSEFPLRDLRIDEVICDPEASLGDALTFHVKVTNQISGSLPTDLSLYEQGKKEPVSKKRLVLTRGSSVVTIGTIPETEGVREFRLAFPVYPEEVDTKNNEYVVHVTVVKRDLKALLVAAEPTREYFYLVPALLRDPVVNLACYLQSRDEDYTQQGNTAIERLPETTEQWSRYDVVILYDVDPSGPNGLTTAMVAGLEAMVNKGGGLLVIGGPNHSLAKMIQVHAAKFRGLLPVEIDKNRLPDYEKRYPNSFMVERTPGGKGHPVLRASGKEDLNEKIWNNFPKFYWFHPVQSVKPRAVTLLKRGGNPADGGGACLMAVHGYGEGKVFFSGLNALWRWRFPAESYDYDRFWTRCIRYLGEAKLGKQANAQLDTDRRSYSPGEEVRINLLLLDPSLHAQLAGQKLFATVTTPQKVEQNVELAPEPDGAPIFHGKYRAREVGSLLVRARQAAPGADSEAKALFDVKHSFMVRMESLEGRDTSANLEGMRDLAERTDGKYYDYHNMKDLDALIDAIPKEPQILSEQVLLEVWDGSLFLVLFLVLACAEWSLRKWWGLL